MEIIFLNYYLESIYLLYTEPPYLHREEEGEIPEHLPARSIPMILMKNNLQHRVVSCGFEWFWVGSGGFGWFRVGSGGFHV